MFRKESCPRSYSEFASHLSVCAQLHISPWPCSALYERNYISQTPLLNSFQGVLTNGRYWWKSRGQERGDSENIPWHSWPCFRQPVQGCLLLLFESGFRWTMPPSIVSVLTGLPLLHGSKLLPDGPGFWVLITTSTCVIPIPEMIMGSFCY